MWIRGNKPRPLRLRVRVDGLNNGGGAERLAGGRDLVVAMRGEERRRRRSSCGWQAVEGGGTLGRTPSRVSGIQTRCPAQLKSKKGTCTSF